MREICMSGSTRGKADVMQEVLLVLQAVAYSLHLLFYSTGYFLHYLKQRTETEMKQKKIII
jgi:hypothetical protein